MIRNGYFLRRYHLWGTEAIHVNVANGKYTVDRAPDLTRDWVDHSRIELARAYEEIKMLKATVAVLQARLEQVFP